MGIEALIEALSSAQEGENPLADFSSDDLSSSRGELVDLLKEEGRSDDPSLDQMRALRKAIDAIDTESGEREANANNVREEADTLLEGLEPEAEADEDHESSPVESGEAAEGEGSQTEGEERELVTASLLDAVKHTSARRRSRRERDADDTEANPHVLVATSGPVSGDDVSADGPPEQLGILFEKARKSIRGGRQALVHLQRQFPTDRTLSGSMEENTAKIAAATNPRALTAAGGFCPPFDFLYDLEVCPDRGRPVRDGLPTFNAARGGIRYRRNLTLGDVEGGVGVWTAEDDEAALGEDGPTKACGRPDCPDELEAFVHAITACWTIGNFQARFSPEIWDATLQALWALHDRTAEAELIRQFDENADEDSNTYTQTFSPSTEDGSVYNVLSTIGRGAAFIRSQDRLIESSGLRMIAPTWLRDALRDHLVRQNPSGGVDLYTLADATIDQFFSSKNIAPIWSPDIQPISSNGQYPESVELRLFPEGSWLFLDGGTLDLGQEITDSALNSTNDRQAFMETFEGMAFRGCRSLRTEVPLTVECICDGGS